MKSKMIGIFVVVFFLFCIAQIGEAVKPKCEMPGCDNEQTKGSQYCFLHDLSYHTYGNPDYHAIYQLSRERQKRAANTYSANKTSASGKTANSSAFSAGGTGARKYSNSSTGSKRSNSTGNRSVDPYDADEFDNADDFADEWAEEFGDGDFEEGYEDAYDYWKYEYGG